MLVDILPELSVNHRASHCAAGLHTSAQLMSYGHEAFDYTGMPNIYGPGVHSIYGNGDPKAKRANRSGGGLHVQQDEDEWGQMASVSALPLSCGAPVVAQRAYEAVPICPLPHAMLCARLAAEGKSAGKRKASPTTTKPSREAEPGQENNGKIGHTSRLTNSQALMPTKVALKAPLQNPALMAPQMMSLTPGAPKPASEGRATSARKKAKQKTYGTKREVWKGIAKRTRYGLTKSDLTPSKTGKIVSKRQKQIGEELYKKFGRSWKLGCLKALGMNRLPLQSYVKKGTPEYRQAKQLMLHESQPTLRQLSIKESMVK